MSGGENIAMHKVGENYLHVDRARSLEWEGRGDG